jgi:ABC-type dipeptide/oligopeptide/nickel transport system permease component
VGPYLLRRLAQAVVSLFVLSVFAFAMIHLVPGNPVQIMLGTEATPPAVRQLTHSLGLDRPLYVQYLSYTGRLLHGDFGDSIHSGLPVTDEIGSRIGSTVQLALAAMVIAVPLGILMGTVAAAVRRPALDFLIMTLALVGLSMPTFWSGLLLILVFALLLHWLPVVGTGPSGLVLPAIALALPAAAVLARMTRANLLEVLGQDFIRTARAKGLSWSWVVSRHGLRNAFIPVLTIIALQLGGLLSGTVIVESVFGRSGVGRLAIQAIEERDFPLVQGVILLAGAVFIAVNLVTDLLYPLVDPRIRLR